MARHVVATCRVLPPSLFLMSNGLKTRHRQNQLASFAHEIARETVVLHLIIHIYLNMYTILFDLVSCIPVFVKIQFYVPFKIMSAHMKSTRQ